MAAVAADKLGKEICDVLGLKHCTLLDIHIAKDEIITVTAKFYPDKDDVMQFPAILKKYELVEIKDTKGEYGLDGPNDQKAPMPRSMADEIRRERMEVA